MTMTQEQAIYLRKAFWYMNKYMMVPFFKVGMSRWLALWPEGFGQILVITHQGRKSGKTYQTPVNYAFIDDAFYVTAGFGKRADWYQNILQTPEVDIWLEDNTWFSGTAKDVSEEVDFCATLRKVLIGSGFAAHAAGINPSTITDDELMELAGDYRLVRINREDPRTGSGGPGEYGMDLAGRILDAVDSVHFPAQAKAALEL